MAINNMNKRYWLRGGIIGGVAFLLAVILQWVTASVSMDCLLEPLQAVNLGGADCYFKNYFSIWSVVYFLVPTFAGFLFGMLGGFCYRRINDTNKKPVRIFLVILCIPILLYVWRSLL